MAAVCAAAHQHCSAPRTGSRKPWQCYLQGLSTASGPAASNPLWGSRAVTAFGKSRQEINSLSWHGHREKSLTGSHLWSRRARGHQRAAGEGRPATTLRERGCLPPHGDFRWRRWRKGLVKCWVMYSTDGQDSWQGSAPGIVQELDDPCQPHHSPALMDPLPR